jgi:hypothetical protein
MCLCLWTFGWHTQLKGAAQYLWCGRAAEHLGGARLTHTYPCAVLCGCETHHMRVHECPWVTEVFRMITHNCRSRCLCQPVGHIYISWSGLVVYVSWHPTGNRAGGAPYLSSSSVLGPGSSLCILMIHLESGGGGGFPTWELEEGEVVKKDWQEQGNWLS